MEISSGKLHGLLYIKMKPFNDERGSFSRNFCSTSLIKAGGDGNVSQANISINKTKGTIRGLHYQSHPYSETKTVTSYRGSLFYNVIDLRVDSPTFLETESFEIGTLGLSVQIPAGCAPGFQTLEDDVILHYYVSAPYKDSHEFGIRFDDPQFRLKWPLEPTVVSARDRSFPNFEISSLPQLGGML